MDVRSLQRPLKDAYRQDPSDSRITLVSHGQQADAPIFCSVDLGRAIVFGQTDVTYKFSVSALKAFDCNRLKATVENFIV